MSYQTNLKIPNFFNHALFNITFKIPKEIKKSLEAFAAKEFNEIFSGRQLPQEVKVYRHFEESKPVLVLRN